MSTPKARVGKGTPAGGEFKAVANGEATGSLAPSMPEGRDARIAAAFEMAHSAEANFGVHSPEHQKLVGAAKAIQSKAQAENDAGLLRAPKPERDAVAIERQLAYEAGGSGMAQCLRAGREYGF